MPQAAESPSGFAAKFADVACGKDIDGELAKSITYLLTNRLAEKPMQAIQERYPTPANCTALQVPKCNPPIWESLKPHARNTDIKIQKVQKSLVAGLTAVTTTVHGQLPENMQNGLACLAAANFELNMMRRELLRPGLQDKFSQLCKPSVPITSMLFGDDLSKHIRELSEVHRATGKVARVGRFRPYGSYGHSYGSYGHSYGRGRGSYMTRRPFLGGRGSQFRRYRPQLSARGRWRGGAARSQSQ